MHWHDALNRVNERLTQAARAEQFEAAGDLRHDDVLAAHWIIPELDRRGGIDGHAAMCLRLAITDAVAGPGAAIVIDLRDLAVADDDAVALLMWADDACRAHAIQLGLLVDARGPPDELAGVLARAGITPHWHVVRRSPTRGRRRRPRRVHRRD